MKTVTTADLRNHFRRVSAWLDNGETVEILKRGKPYARLLPLIPPPAQNLRVDFAAQRREVWKGRKFSASEVVAMRAAELEGEEYNVCRQSAHGHFACGERHPSEIEAIPEFR